MAQVGFEKENQKPTRTSVKRFPHPHAHVRVHPILGQGNVMVFVPKTRDFGSVRGGISTRLCRDFSGGLCWAPNDKMTIPIVPSRQP